MFAFISGTLVSLAKESAIVENNGIGYRIFCPSSTLDRLSVGETVTLYTHFAVREDAMLLYGFPSQEELDLFRMLIGVSGVGPKGAMGILSVLTPEDLRSAVLTEDAQAIAKAPGIGKKTAQKVILELRDRMDLMDSFTSASGDTGSADLSGDASPASEAVLALAALGYARTDAASAVRAVTDGQAGMDVETILKAALKRL